MPVLGLSMCTFGLEFLGPGHGPYQSLVPPSPQEEAESHSRPLAFG